MRKEAGSRIKSGMTEVGDCAPAHHPEPAIAQDKTVRAVTDSRWTSR
jgi:hypothetical protein